MTDAEGLPQNPRSGESRKSTRFRLKVLIEACGMSEPLRCEGETFVFNFQASIDSDCRRTACGDENLDSCLCHRGTRYC
jgi:hypothetical protein